MARVKKPKGRPPLSERTSISSQEEEYCKLRASGMSTYEAATTLGRFPSEIEKIEQEHPLISLRIKELSSHQFDTKLQTFAETDLKLITDLTNWVNKEIAAGEMNVDKMSKAFDVREKLAQKLEKAKMQAAITSGKKQVTKSESILKNYLEKAPKPSEEEMVPIYEGQVRRIFRDHLPKDRRKRMLKELLKEYGLMEENYLSSG